MANSHVLQGQAALAGDRARWAVAALAFGFWWTIWPYLGIYHDALFYTADALRHLAPQSLAKDVFFGHGTQGDRSIYGPLYSQVIAHLGVGPASFWMTWAGRTFWLAAFWALCRSLFEPKPAMWLFALGLVLPSTYDGFQIFSYDEAFATPRQYAEALGLLALVAVVKGRWGWGAAALLAAIAFHPLMALPVLGTLFFLLPVPWRWRLGLAGSLLLAGLAWAHVGPFGALLQTFDTAWWALITERNPYVVLAEWDGGAISRLLLTFILLAATGWGHAGPEGTRRLARALTWMLLAAMGLAAFGEATGNVLLVQLQLWRAMWLAKLLSPLLWLHTLPRPSRWTRLDALQVLFFGAATICSIWPAAVMALAGLALRRPAVQAVFASPTLRRTLLGAAAACLLIAVMSRLPDGEIAYHFFGLQGSDMPLANALSGQAWISLCLLGAVAWAVLRGPAWLGGTVLASSFAVCAICVLGVTTLAWQRSQQPPEDVHELDQALPADAVVYWTQGLNPTWLLLRRAYYASSMQGAGNLFSRDNAMELARRLRRLSDLGLVNLSSKVDLTARAEPVKVVEGTPLATALCQDPVLDWVVLSGTLPQADQVVATGSHRLSQSLFNCQRLRRGAPS